MTRQFSAAFIRVASPSLALVLGMAPLPAHAQSVTDLSFGQVLRSFDVDPTDDSHLVATVNQVVAGSQVGSLRESFNGGQSWQEVRWPDPSVTRGYASFAPDGALFLGLSPTSANPTQLVYRRSVGSWTALGPALTDPGGLNYGEVLAVAVASFDPQLLAFVYSISSPGLELELYRVWVSNDGGTNWSMWSSGSGDVRVEFFPADDGPRLAVDRISCDKMGCSAVLEAQAPWGGPTYVMRSSFQSWYQLAIGRLHSERMYYSRVSFYDCFDPEEVQHTEDAGQTWSGVGTAGCYRTVARGNLDPDLVVRQAVDYVAGQQGAERLELSRDGGGQWTDLQLATPGNGPGGAQIDLKWSPDDTRLYAWRGNQLFAYDLNTLIGSSECTSSPNGSGVGASMAAQGSESVGASDLLLWARNMPANRLGIIAASTTADLVPFGFGNLCLGGLVGRMTSTLLDTGPHGEFTVRLDLGAIPTPAGPVPVLPGETWRFQALFRDGMGVPGVNTSDAIAVTFVP